MLWICKKSFSFHHFSYNQSLSTNESNLTLIIINILFLLRHYNHILSIGYTILMLLRICKKSFSFHHFLVIKVHMWNVWNLDSHNNLHFFCDWALQSCSSRWDTRYWCFGLAREAFLSIDFLIIKVHCEMEETWILLITSILFVIGTPIMFISLGYTILMLWYGHIGFFFQYFPHN